jgi:formylglycine-generating enzyme required for sulfatase activity
MKNNLKSKLTIIVLTIAMPLWSYLYADKYYVNISGFVGEDLVSTISKARANAGIDTIYVGFGVYQLDTELIIEDVVIGGCVPDGKGGITRRYLGTVGNSRVLQTILDGNSFLRVFPSQKHRVATLNDGGVLEGCVIRNGHARGTTDDLSDMSGHGGGVLVNGGKLYNCIIRGNVAMNEAYSVSNPGKGGGVFITANGGDVVNCIIAFNMDDKGLGIGGYGGVIVNNTISRNVNAPRFVLVPGNMNGDPEYRHYAGKNNNLTNEKTGPYIRLDDFYMAATETTKGQYACFLAAVDLNRNCAVNQHEWTKMCNSLTPMTGYTDIKIVNTLGMAANEVLLSPKVMTTGGYDAKNIVVSGEIGGGEEVYYADKASSHKYYAGQKGGVSFPDDPLVRENFPMENVSWYGALAYSIWLGCFLPTEAQWEFAARRTSVGLQNYAAYAGGTILWDHVGWSTQNAYSGHREVGLLIPTQLGIYDMNGNAYEYVCDWNNTMGANAEYPTGSSVLIGSTPTKGCYTVSRDAGNKGNDADSPLYNPIFNYKAGDNRLTRGGSHKSDKSYFVLGSRGNGQPPATMSEGLGFRVVKCVGCP